MAASTGRTKANCMGTYILLGISLHFILGGPYQVAFIALHRIASHRIAPAFYNLILSDAGLLTRTVRSFSSFNSQSVRWFFIALNVCM